MAQIILVWGVHPNESEVTQELAKMLQKNLAEKGHTSTVIQFPHDFTIHAHAEKSGFADMAEYESALKEEHAFFKTLFHENPRAFVLDLHSSPVEGYRFHKPRASKVKFWSTKPEIAKSTSAPISNPRFNPTLKPGASMLVFGELSLPQIFKHPSYFVVELPAAYRASRKTWSKLKPRVFDIWFSGPDSYHWFGIEADLKKTKAANFLSPTTVAKLSHAIDRTVNTRLGVYGKPRRMPFRPKAKKPAEQEIQARRLGNNPKRKLAQHKPK